MEWNEWMDKVLSKNYSLSSEWYIHIYIDMGINAATWVVGGRPDGAQGDIRSSEKSRVRVT